MHLFDGILKRKWISGIILLILFVRETNGYGWTVLYWDWPYSTVRAVNDTVNSVAARVIRCCAYLEEWRQPTGSWKPASTDVVTYVNGIYHSEEDWQVNIYILFLFFILPILIDKPPPPPVKLPDFFLLITSRK